MITNILIFVGSLAAVGTGSVFISRSINRLGKRLGIQEEFLGFITALGADSPEISSAIVALLAGQHDVGAGVVFGSNLFNLATLMGLAAVIGDGLIIGRSTVVFNGAVSTLVTVSAIGMVMGYWGAWAAVISMVLVLIPYVVVLWMNAEQTGTLPLPERWRGFLKQTAGESREHGRKMKKAGDAEDQRPAASLWSPALHTLGSLALIIAGSTGLVRTTTELTAGWLPRGACRKFLVRPLLRETQRPLYHTTRYSDLYVLIDSIG